MLSFIKNKIRVKKAKKQKASSDQRDIQTFSNNLTSILFEHGIYDSFDNTITPKNISVIDEGGSKGISCILKFPYGLSSISIEKCIPSFKENLFGKCMVFVEDLEKTTKLTVIKEWFCVDYKEERTKTPLNVFIGYDAMMNPIVLNFAKNPHMLVTGSSGGGKSKFIEVLITNLSLQFTPKELEMYFVQVGKGDQFKYELLKHCKGCVTSSSSYNGKGCLDMAIDLLEHMMKTLQEREDVILQTIKRSDEDISIDVYNSKSNKKMSAIYLFIDEASSLFEIDPSMNKEEKEIHTRACKICKEIAKRGRFVGINLIIAQQRASKDELPRMIKINCNNRLTFKQTDASASMVAIGDDYSALGLQPQVFVYKSGSDIPLYGKTPQSNWTNNIKLLTYKKRTKKDDNKTIIDSYCHWLNSKEEVTYETITPLDIEVSNIQEKIGDVKFKNATQLKETFSNNKNHSVKMQVDKDTLSEIYKNLKR